MPAMQETQVQSLGWEDPLSRKQQLTPIFLPGKFHGKRSLLGYSPWACKESDMTDRLNTHTQAKECLESKGARIDKQGFSPAVYTGSMTCRYLAFRLLASRTMRKYISVVASHLVCGDCYVTPSSYVVIVLCYDSLRKKYTLSITENHTRRNQQNGPWN